MQAYFLAKLDASDMISIGEFVRVFCSNYGQVLEGEMPINVILSGNPSDNLEPSSVNNIAIVIEVFAEDRA